MQRNSSAPDDTSSSSSHSCHSHAQSAYSRRSPSPNDLHKLSRTRSESSLLTPDHALELAKDKTHTMPRRGLSPRMEKFVANSNLQTFNSMSNMMRRLAGKEKETKKILRTVSASTLPKSPRTRLTRAESAPAILSTVSQRKAAIDMKPASKGLALAPIKERGLPNAHQNKLHAIREDDETPSVKKLARKTVTAKVADLPMHNGVGSLTSSSSSSSTRMRR